MVGREGGAAEGGFIFCPQIYFQAHSFWPQISIFCWVKIYFVGVFCGYINLLATFLVQFFFVGNFLIALPFMSLMYPRLPIAFNLFFAPIC